jgi:hypothetical protein
MPNNDSNTDARRAVEEAVKANAAYSVERNKLLSRAEAEARRAVPECKTEADKARWNMVFHSTMDHLWEERCAVEKRVVEIAESLAVAIGSEVGANS